MSSFRKLPGFLDSSVDINSSSVVPVVMTGHLFTGMCAT